MEIPFEKCHSSLRHFLKKDDFAEEVGERNEIIKRKRTVRKMKESRTFWWGENVRVIKGVDNMTCFPMYR